MRFSSCEIQQDRLVLQTVAGQDNFTTSLHVNYARAVSECPTSVRQNILLNPIFLTKAGRFEDDNYIFVSCFFNCVHLLTPVIIFKQNTMYGI